MFEKEKRILGQHFTVNAAAQELGVAAAPLCVSSSAERIRTAYLKKSEPRTPEDLAQAARVRTQILIAAKESKGLAKRVVELEDVVSFMHSAPAHPPVIKRTPARPKSGKRPGTPMFMLSDLHIGEVVTLEETLGVNRYDLDVARGRMSECFSNMLWLRKDMSRTVSCDDTFLTLNGDIVTGDIHDELRETNAGGLRTQCDAAVSMLYPGIVEMADATPNVMHIVCIGGNHGRLTKKQHQERTEHSIEHIGVYDTLRRLIGDRGGKIAWHIPRAERHVMNVQGWRVSTQHGTMIKSQGGIGGTLVPMTRWATRADDADLYLFGHFHEDDAYGSIVKNGSLIGESAYGKWIGVKDRAPKQVAWILDPDHGVRRFERVSVLTSAEKRARVSR
jgi:hypothetical protein